MHAAREPDPALAAHDPGADDQHGDQGNEAKAVDPVDGVQELVVVEDGHDKHGHQTSGNPDQLQLLKTLEAGVEGGAVNLKDADDREDHHKRKERPVKITEGKETAHTIHREPRLGSC